MYVSVAFRVNVLSTERFSRLALEVDRLLPFHAKVSDCKFVYFV